MDKPSNDPLERCRHEFTAYPVVPLTERLEEWADGVRVKWLLMDAQSKQMLLLGALYLGYTLLDVLGAVAKARAGAKT